ncbi:hypothetical protein OS493_004071 [Desmophyllum pertusum]|uniref:Uncharacterized protein n=1 Tax=Desmophyllum pertusum TaxID=174260 RepID=A0A9W9ZSV4_9CNID|nr:hypothetical protein OS493_004071 [Desmophyllum pertusum]
MTPHILPSRPINTKKARQSRVEQTPLASRKGSYSVAFFDQDLVPYKCGCGETVTFHVECEDAKWTPSAFSQSLVSAAHIKRSWFDKADIHALDECKCP